MGEKYLKNFLDITVINYIFNVYVNAFSVRTI